MESPNAPNVWRPHDPYKREPAPATTRIPLEVARSVSRSVSRSIIADNPPKLKK